MDKLKVLETTKDLKFLFEKKKLKVSEVKECMFRMIDYIDTRFDEDSLETPFKNGNGNIFKDKKPAKGIKLEVMNGIRTRVN